MTINLNYLARKTAFVMAPECISAVIKFVLVAVIKTDTELCRTDKH